MVSLLSLGPLCREFSLATSLFHQDLICETPVLADNINRVFVNIMKDYQPLTDSVRVSVEDDEPITVTEELVEKKLRAISTSRASGPDELPNWVLKEYSDILAAPITVIMNSSFVECRVPRVWKIADVPPIPKSRIICDYNKDLRPISLTATLSKVAESLLIDQELKPAIMSSIDPAQYGFIPGSSTSHSLISMLHTWLGATDSTGATVRTALLDFRKAFDLVDHHVLIAKLYSLGVKPTVVNWIVDFLRDRQQRVKINETRSSWMHVPAGVPQGTRIGHWLFVVMINDLQLLSDESFHIWKFADDTNVSEIVPPSCPSSLQQVVEEISSWSCENHLELNPSKCKELRTCFKRSPPSYAPVISDGLEFEQVSTAKILGVTFRQDLKWNDHIDNITAKAAKRLYLLRKLKRAGVSCNELVLFYCSAIRSVLECACMLFHRSLP